MQGEPKPMIGMYAAMTDWGHVWPDTISLHARTARDRCGADYIGLSPTKGQKIETPADGWQYAKRKGMRIVKVDVVPHGAAHD